jgi:hypothetical protein
VGAGGGDPGNERSEGDRPRSTEANRLIVTSEAHTDDVLTQVEYSLEEIARLRAGGVA